MKPVGYMLNTYDEYGPENIAFFPIDADMSAALAEYVKARNPSEAFLNGDVSQDTLQEWLTDPNRSYNKAQDLCHGWGGVQITELAAK
jgi:hypothetical protein